MKVMRAERDWNKAKIADRLEVYRKTVKALETGKFDPSLPIDFKAARLFALTIEDIFQDDTQ